MPTVSSWSERVIVTRVTWASLCAVTGSPTVASRAFEIGPDTKRMQMGRGFVVVSLTILLVAAACGSSRTSARSAVVTATGRIGPLHLDRSDRAAVVAFAGRPDAERRAEASGGYAPYEALGYGCATTAVPLVTALAAGGPYCRTVFFVNRQSGRLETFFTTAARYSEGHGVRIGMPTAVAERLLRRRLVEGCETNLYLSSARASLTIAFTGGVVRRKTLHVIGGHVYAFVLHSHRSDAGVFDCL